LRLRNAVLEGLERCRRTAPQVSLGHIVALLYVAENEGLNITELGDVCRTTTATASRTARALMARTTADALPPWLGLLEARPNPEDSKGRLLYLTPAGRALCQQLDEIIALGTHIFPAPPVYHSANPQVTMVQESA
jgi:DNA-binding MarR family transcriptional regulator